MANVTPFTFFHSTHRVRYAPGALNELGSLAEEFGCRQAVVIADEFFIGSEVEARLGDVLGSMDPVFHGVPQHEPDTDTIEAARAFLTESQPDLIIALGGGSAMDAAKVARMCASNPGPIENIVGPVGVKMMPHDSLFVCVPTTAGTGSEVSESAIISKTGSDYKMIFRSSEMTARVAILDPQLSVTAPPGVTASSGYDAVTHAVEAFTSKASGPVTDPIAVSAMERLARWLPVAYAEPGNLEARGECLIGSMQAAIAFNSAHLGLAHAIAGALGALHHVPHGLANALGLPWTMAFNHPQLGEKGDLIAGLYGGGTAAEGLSRLRHTVGLDISLDDYVTGEAALDDVAKGASRSGQVRVNPRESSVQEIRTILEAMRQPTDGGQPDLNL
ncbi:MAG: iron-containing alcohol dehydrogenase [Rhodobacteraceae bacterium]|nr:iron-containing alcohol dehydrogenase [Paracoccaceae bacterium]